MDEVFAADCRAADAQVGDDLLDLQGVPQYGGVGQRIEARAPDAANSAGTIGAASRAMISVRSMTAGSSVVIRVASRCCRVASRGGTG